MVNLIEYKVEDGVAWLTLNDPARRNPISLALAEELVAACDRIDADSTIGAAVIRGAGGYFSSGGSRPELGAISADPYSELSQRQLSTIYSAFLRVGRLEVVSVAAIQGGAIGAGFNLALATDVRIAAADARLASGFATIGVHPGGGHLALLGRISPQLAFAAGVLDAPISGERAVELGLCFAAAPADEVDALAASLVARAGANPDLARRICRSARVELGPPLLTWPAAVELEREAQLRSFADKGQTGWA